MQNQVQNRDFGEIMTDKMMMMAPENNNKKPLISPVRNPFKTNIEMKKLLNPNKNNNISNRQNNYG